MDIDKLALDLYMKLRQPNEYEYFLERYRLKKIYNRKIYLTILEKADKLFKQYDEVK